MKLLNLFKSKKVVAKSTIEKVNKAQLGKIVGGTDKGGVSEVDIERAGPR